MESNEKQKTCKLLAETSIGRQYTVESNEKQKICKITDRNQPLMVGNILWSPMRNRKVVNY